MSVVEWRQTSGVDGKERRGFVVALFCFFVFCSKGSLILNRRQVSMRIMDDIGCDRISIKIIHTQHLVGAVEMKIPPPAAASHHDHNRTCLNQLSHTCIIV